MTVCFEVAAQGRVWVLRSDGAVIGQFRTQMEAFNAAVAQARQLKKEGRAAQVRVIRDGAPGEAMPAV